VCWKPRSSCWSFDLHREEFLSAPIHSPPLSGSLYRSFNLELEFKEVREAAAAEKKKLEDELAGEKRKAVEATMQFNTAATGRSNAYPF
jgi:hypothetical protein